MSLAALQRLLPRGAMRHVPKVRPLRRVSHFSTTSVGRPVLRSTRTGLVTFVSLGACGAIGFSLGVADSGEAKCDDVPLDRVPRAPKRVMPAGVYDIPLGKDFPESMPCFIEVSKGSRNKYEWDNDIGLLRLDRVLHSAVFYPHNYGFVPQTMCEDGDALDVLVLGETCVPGSIVDIRPLGYMIMEDEKGLDEKVLAVPTHDPRFSEYQTLRDVPEHLLREIAHFFDTYKALEKKKWAKVGGWKGTEDTKLLIEATHKKYVLKQKQKILEEYNRGVYKMVRVDSAKKKLEDYNKDVYRMVRKESQKPLEEYNAKVYDEVQRAALEGYNDRVYNMVRKESRKPLEKYNAEVYDKVQKEAQEAYNDKVYKMVRKESQKPLEEYNAKVYDEVQREAQETYNDKVYNMVRRESAAAKQAGSN